MIMSGVVKPLQVKGLPLIFHRFCLVVMIQEATGSATVVMTAAAGSVLPIISSFPGVNFKSLVLAIGLSSLIPSHLNDEDLR
ncbi:GntP family permease [Bacillus sp. OK838]|nr:GntP family permease [Bacillus sp. OK838]